VYQHHHPPAGNSLWPRWFSTVCFVLALIVETLIRKFFPAFGSKKSDGHQVTITFPISHTIASLTLMNVFEKASSLDVQMTFRMVLQPA
jgi:hypothetical protein